MAAETPIPRKRITAPEIAARKGGEPIVSLTSYHAHTAAIADPFVDKVLVIGTMVYLAVMDWSRPWFPAWVVVVIIAREFLVTGIRGYVESKGLEFPADWFGKVKMVIQCIAIGIVLGLFAFDWPEPLRKFLTIAAHVFVWGTLLTTVGSGTSYVLKTRKLLEKSTQPV